MATNTCTVSWLLEMYHIYFFLFMNSFKFLLEERMKIVDDIEWQFLVFLTTCRISGWRGVSIQTWIPGRCTTPLYRPGVEWRERRRKPLCQSAASASCDHVCERWTRCQQPRALLVSAWKLSGFHIGVACCMLIPNDLISRANF